MKLAAIISAVLSVLLLAFAVALLAHTPRTPCRCVAAPGFELVEWRIQEPGTRAWARYRIEGGRAEMLGWESSP